MRRILLIILLLTTIPVYSQQENTVNDEFILGIKGGYSPIIGYYKSHLSGSYYLGLYTLFDIPYLNLGNFLKAEVDFVFSSYKLSNNKDSYVNSFSLDAGPVVYYPLFAYLHPYMGASFRANYYHLNASSTDIDEETIKPGFVAKAGFFIPVSRGISTRIGFEYTLAQLSGEYMQTMDIYAGVSFNLYAYIQPEYEERIDSKLKDINRYYDLGVKEFDNGEPVKARKNFNKVLSLDKGHKEAGRYIKKIDQVEKLYAKAVELMKDKRYYKAIPLLEKAGHNMKKAMQDLARARKLLSGETLLLEKKGKDAYEKKNYEKCIAIMKKLVLIDPDNKAAKIYLPRAEKRYRALQKLK